MFISCFGRPLSILPRVFITFQQRIGDAPADTEARLQYVVNAKFQIAVVDVIVYDLMDVVGWRQRVLAGGHAAG